MSRYVKSFDKVKFASFVFQKTQLFKNYNKIKDSISNTMQKQLHKDPRNKGPDL